MKMSGASPELSAVWSLPSISSFWIDWISIVTPGLAVSKAAAVSSQYALPGPVVELCQNVSVTSPSEDPLSSPPHAVRPTAPIITAVVTARSFLDFMISVLIVELPSREVFPAAPMRGRRRPGATGGCRAANARSSAGTVLVIDALLVVTRGTHEQLLH